MTKYIIITVFILYIAVDYFVKNRSKEAKRIIVGFNFLWGIALVASLCSFSGKYAISASAYLLIVIAVISFNMGFYYKSRQTLTLEKLQLSVNYIIYNKVFNVIIILLAVYLLSLFLTYIDALAVASAADLRTDFFDEENNLYGPLFLFLNTWLLKPISILLMPLFPMALIQKKYGQAVLYISYLLVYNSLGGGRFGYTQIAWSLYLVCICLYQVVKIKLSIRNALIAFVVFLGFYGLIALTTASRMANFDINRINYDKVLKETNTQISAYVSGPIAAFSYAIDNNYVKEMGGYQYGKLTLGAFDQVADIAFRKIGVGYERAIPKLATIKQDSKIEINEDFPMWNALYTSNLFFYLDFGIVGVLVFPFIFARLFSKSLSLMQYKQNVMSLVLVNYVFVNCMHSVFDFRLYNLADLVTISVLLILIYKTKAVKM